MSDCVIKIENVSKQYRLGQLGTGSLSHDINRLYHSIRGKADPYLKIGEENDRTIKASSDYIWALQDISFEVNKGEVLGIIGRNGAGKSTLLKILSRTTMPTKGSIKAKGRIASLLEVGTGFHPDLSGRDNIFLNGAILGMSKREIIKKFDEIVDFAGVERYIDTPVKRYSSGMYVRLAFGVAAHLESEILIVDEVLAVGDNEFQKKCLGKMKDISSGEGRTVLFVSHNMPAVQTLTDKCLYLKNGRYVSMGYTDEIIQLYNENDTIAGKEISYYEKQSEKNDKPIELLKCSCNKINEHIDIKIDYIVRRNIGSVVAIKINNSRDIPIMTLRDMDIDPEIFSKTPGKYSISFKVPLSMLAEDQYRITVSFADMKIERFDYHENLLAFFHNSSDVIDMSIPREGILQPKLDFIGETTKYE